MTLLVVLAYIAAVAVNQRIGPSGSPGGPSSGNPSSQPHPPEPQGIKHSLPPGDSQGRVGYETQSQGSKQMCTSLI